MEDKHFINDHQGFQLLVERYYSVMLAVAKSIIGSSLAEEVVQEAWLGAYKNLAKFEGRSSIKIWLVTITSNTELV
ncbi:MAG: RNA polymerase sigma-70 factor (ECF subfamily) [Pseudohongiellaceae bacterium]|jgi:RNA polymerase sigma-70 factor (ECF subfamily)